MIGIKGNGLISEGGGVVATTAKKSGKTVVRETGKFAKEVYEQLVGTQKPPPPPKVEPNGEREEAETQARIRQIQANLRQLAAKEKEEREKIAQIQEYYRGIREAKLAAEEEEEKRKLSPLGALDWFVKMGKKARGWIFERKRGEKRPAGFHG
jgi:hypothetical protein